MQHISYHNLSTGVLIWTAQTGLPAADHPPSALQVVREVLPQSGAHLCYWDADLLRGIAAIGPLPFLVSITQNPGQNMTPFEATQHYQMARHDRFLVEDALGLQA